MEIEHFTSDNIFLRNFVQFNLFNTCMNEYLCEIDRYILRRCCKTLYYLLKKEENEKYDKIELYIKVLKKGYFELYEYFENNDYIFKIARYFSYFAYSEKDEIVQYKLIEKHSCGNLRNLYESAASEGNLKLIIWMKEKYGMPKENLICYCAAKKGHFHILKWAKENDCPFDMDSPFYCSTFEAAIEFGDLNILKWLKTNNCRMTPPYARCSVAARNGRFEILKWLVENGCTLGECVFEDAVSFGNLEILKWLKENQCPWDELSPPKAALYGDFEILKWLKDNNCPWDERTCSAAAIYGDLEILKWLRLNNCPWDHYVYHNAIVNKHDEIIQWAMKNGLLIDNQTIQFAKLRNYDFNKYISF